MKTGLIVIMVFAAAWGAVALAAVGAPVWTWPAPTAISALIFAAVGPRTPSSSDRPPQERRRVGRLVALWSGIEGAGMLLAVAVLQATGRTRLVVPAATLAVALHFLPLARGLPFPRYYATGLAMTATSLGALWLPGAWPMITAAGAAALVLWATAFGFPRKPAVG